MTGRVKLKGKHKRGERGSVEEEHQSLKRANMADEEEVCSTNDKEVPNTDSEETVQQRTNIEETSLSELKEMLVDIQITVSDILRQNSKLTNEVTELRSAFHQQKTELTAVKTSLSKMMKQQDDLETELVAARKRISEQDDEIAELYDLQDDLEQYTRKNSLEIHGVPESAYTSTEEVVLKLAGAINVDVKPEDIEISHKLYSKGVKPVIVKFQNHKVKSNLYKARTKLRNVRVSDLFPSATAATRVASERIFLNENLTSFRRELLKQANKKRKEGLLVSAWSMDGKIFIKTSPEGRPLRVYDKNDLENL